MNPLLCVTYIFTHSFQYKFKRPGKTEPILKFYLISFCSVIFCAGDTTATENRYNGNNANSQESLESLIRAQIRVLESQLFNKSSELQEDISMKKFDLQAKKLHLAAIRAQVNKWYTNIHIQFILCMINIECIKQCSILCRHHMLHKYLACEQNEKRKTQNIKTKINTFYMECSSVFSMFPVGIAIFFLLFFNILKQLLCLSHFEPPTVNSSKME